MQGPTRCSVGTLLLLILANFLAPSWLSGQQANRPGPHLDLEEEVATIELTSDGAFANQSPETAILPTAYYTPETSFAFGGLWARVWTAESDATAEDPSDLTNAPSSLRQSSVDLSGSYTLEDQLVFSSNIELHPSSGRMIMGRARIAPRWPDRFYPVGNSAGPDDYEEWTARSVRARLQALWRVGDAPLFLGPTMDLQHSRILEREPGGALAGGSLLGTATHTLIGGGGAAVWDTRDASVWPRSGSFHTSTLVGMTDLAGSAANLLRFEVDLRRYRPLGERAVLALRGRVIVTAGDVPFTMHARVGGGEGGLRGVHESRYADRVSGLAVVEVRRPLFWRIGGVAFAGAGRVASHLGDLIPGGFHPAGGMGLRFGLIPESELNVALDVATGGDGLSVYVSLGEAF